MERNIIIHLHCNNYYEIEADMKLSSNVLLRVYRMTSPEQETQFSTFPVDTASTLPPAPSVHSYRLRGLLYAVIGAACWGLSGTAAQVLFQYYHVSAQWLVMVRMVGAAIILFAWLRPSFPRQHVLSFVIFALLGLAGVQFTYFAGIAFSNATTTTCLQYTSMPMIALYEVIVLRSPMTSKKLAALIIAFAGLFLLVLGGANGIFALQITIPGLIFGILSAVAAAYYLIASKRFVSSYGVWNMTTWGFLIGGGAMVLLAPPWQVQLPPHPLLFVFLIAFIVIFGTLIAFGLTFSGVKYITSTESSIAISVEPITAALAGFLFLHVTLTTQQYIGAACILLAVTFLSIERGRKRSSV
jgi:drug/metabolite transporter (DMT)-like permease